jgi:hypothetical protein
MLVQCMVSRMTVTEALDGNMSREEVKFALLGYRKRSKTI